MNKPLTYKEEQIMQILWNLKKALVKEIMQELPDPKPPYTTVASVVRKLADQGLVGHQAFGTTYQYFPILKKSKYRKQVFKNMMQNYFGSSPEQVISYFMKEENVDPEELKEWFEKLKDKNK